ncbi:MAG: hypothetical protein H7Y42_10695 [Chitinophagaceae bacterium]|nr:hypothetical protein [Chitinophagaceae bacterium]
MKWFGALAAILLVVACFLPWVTIPSRGLVVTGVDSEGTRFGKPGFFYFLTSTFFLLFSFVPRIWAKRANLAVTALNLAWGIRNFFIITLCRAGDCPEKQAGIYLALAASIVMLLAALFPDIRLKEPKTTTPKSNFPPTTV